MRKTIARNWKFEVTGLLPSGDYSLAAWTQVRGISSFSTDPSKTDADTGDFDSEGWDEHLPASRGTSVSLEGHYLHDPATGDRDPGQEFLEALGEEVDVAGLCRFRVYHKLTGKGKEGDASVEAGGPGGGTNDPAAFSAAMRFTGKPLPVTVAP